MWKFQALAAFKYFTTNPTNMLYTKHLKYILLADFLGLKVQVFQKLPCLSFPMLNIQQTLEMFVQIGIL
jgi:hypothetical protein